MAEILNRLSADVYYGTRTKMNKRELVNVILVSYLLVFAAAILVLMVSVPFEERPTNFETYIAFSVGALIASIALLAQMSQSRTDPKEIMKEMREITNRMKKNQKALIGIKKVLRKIEAHLNSSGT